VIVPLICSRGGRTASTCWVPSDSGGDGGKHARSLSISEGVGDGSGGGSKSPSGPDIEDDMFASIGSSPSLLNLVLVSDPLNIRGEWEVVVLGPYE
jgi:hypothetical protein